MDVTTDSNGFLNPRVLRITKIFFFCSIVLRLFLTFHRTLSPDEFQHLHNAWMIHLGFLPYRDFWDNHTPLLHYILAPILSAVGEGKTSILVARAILSFSGLGILWVVYKIATMLSDKGTAMIAVCLLSFSDIFLQKTIEVRPDQMLSFFWMCSLWMCLRKPGRLFVAGILLGVAVLFSPKALICLAIATFVVAFFSLETIKDRLKTGFTYLAGFFIPLIVLASFFFMQNALPQLLSSTFLDNLKYPDTQRPSFLLYPQNLSFFLLAFVGMVISFLQNKRIEHPLSLLSIAGVSLFLLLAFVMPAPYPQSALIFLPIFSIFAAITIRRSFSSRHIILPAFAVIAGLLVPLINIFIITIAPTSLPMQFRTIEWIIQNTSKEETIFDGDSAYIFRRQADYYGSLVEGIRYSIHRGLIQENIPESLERNDCRIVIYDDRVSDLPYNVQEFLRANYINTGQFDIYVAGTSLTSENFSGSRATLRIAIPAVYMIESNPQSIQIDQKPYAGPIFLEAGIHQLAADEEIRSVLLRSLKSE